MVKGFGRGERNDQELIENPSYADKVGKNVEVYFGNGSLIGVYRGMTNSGELVLNPCLIRGKLDGKGKARETIPALCNENAYIVYDAVSAIVPILDSYLESILKKNK